MGMNTATTTESWIGRQADLPASAVAASMTGSPVRCAGYVLQHHDGSSTTIHGQVSAISDRLSRL